MKEKLIVFEGIDGSGTETQTKKLFQFFRKNNIPAARIEYPDYNGPVGKLIDKYLHKKQELDIEMQVLLHAADRIKDKKKIKNLLSAGNVVICDRYYTSILAYQCSQGFPYDKALQIAEIFEIPVPDKIIFLKISPETSLERKKKEKNGDVDRYEENLEFLRKVAQTYEKLVSENMMGPWYVIDGEKPIDDVFMQVKKVLQI